MHVITVYFLEFEEREKKWNKKWNKKRDKHIELNLLNAQETHSTRTDLCARTGQGLISTLSPPLEDMVIPFEFWPISRK